MENKSQHGRVKYPENLKVRDKLKYNDSKAIAKLCGLTHGTVREIMKGNRPMTDKVKKAIITLFEERKKLDDALDQIINQEEQ
jgi:hypothetical protein